MKICVGFSMFSETQRPYLAMLFTQFVYAGMALLSKAAIDVGMNPFVFVVYRQAFATLALVPFTFLLEKNKAPPMTYSIMFKVFLSSLFGLALGLNLYCVALNYTSATFAAAATNTIPAITFLMAAILRMESISMKRIYGVAKVFGSIICMSGALLVALDKGPAIKFFSWYQSTHEEVSTPNSSPAYNSNFNWIKGPLIMFSANTAWSMWLVVQGPLMKIYPAKMHLTCLQCFFCCIISAMLSIVLDRNPSTWKLGWNIQLLSVAYCGIVVTGITFWLQVWCIEKKGPVFTCMFTPLALLITVIVSALVWQEIVHWGSVGGAVLLVGGLYSVLWGKKKEDFPGDEKKSQQQEAKEEIVSESITHSDLV